ncbi:ferrous iron transport protein B [Capnocytophaga gingivalis]|jgi:ferrous iron transport protein B|uniref:Ferrous iron transport protein B n=1 Tax=Capnocytophaga gingivalis TaxID=1017 RepID=A0A250FQR3_9FLAO|nr:ferrous iron transport protein B [Capnocytophaga gingivalis]ATA87433.1 ferrous iron transport protein B [Capnocytophaga gingivalis]
MSKNEIKVALIGNPNVGKTSIFNLLTGMNQHVGNYPGVTVDKKVGFCKLSQIINARIYDLPGTYSTNPNSMDEKVAVSCLLDRDDIDFPDVVVVVADVENLKQNLYLFTQIKDFGIPTILAINMADRMKPRGITIDIPALEAALHTRIALVSTRQKTGIEELKELIINYKKLSLETLVDIARIDPPFFSSLKEKFPNEELGKLWMVISQNFEVVGALRKVEIQKENIKTEAEIKRMQQRETILRYQVINNALKDTYKVTAVGTRALLDKILLHKVWGYVIFMAILLLIFQVIFYVSEYPKGWIESALGWVGEWLSGILPEGSLTSLLVDGVIPGLTAVVSFVPQIALLFFFISLLEESGYMSRVVFLMDRIMRPFGLNGKGTIPLISGAACAIPAVMATRTIESWRERLIAILVTPFITCSARLPIYLIIIKLVIPQGNYFFFDNQAVALFALYMLGVFMAIFSAWLLNKFLVLKHTIKTHFIIEMPTYKVPLARNVLLTVYEKSKAFVVNAGKIIFFMTVLIWFLQTHGLSEKYRNAETHTEQMVAQYGWDEDQKEHYLLSYRTENSLLGNMGKFVEPVFRPLGYDWKISIAVLGSFAARETFVSTLATIYSLGEVDVEEGEAEQRTVITRLQEEMRPDGTPMFNLATGVSILLFFASAMQCISTFAIVRKETNSWKWAIIQWLFMTGFAYLSAFAAYQILS